MKQFTLGPGFNEFAYNEHPATTRILFCIKIIDSNVKRLLQQAPTYDEKFLLHLNTLCSAIKDKHEWLKLHITSFYRQILRPDQPMNLIV